MVGRLLSEVYIVRIFGIVRSSFSAFRGENRFIFDMSLVRFVCL